MLHFIFFVFFIATIVVPTDLSNGSDVQLFQDDDLITLQDSSENSLAFAGSGDATNPLVIGGDDDVSLFANSSSATTDSSLNVRLSGLVSLDLEASCVPKDGGQSSSKLRARDGGVCAPTTGQSSGGIDDDIDEADGFSENGFSTPQDTPRYFSGYEKLDGDCLPEFPKRMCCTNQAVLQFPDVVQDFLDCVPGMWYCLKSYPRFLYNVTIILTRTHHLDLSRVCRYPTFLRVCCQYTKKFWHDLFNPYYKGMDCYLRNQGQLPFNWPRH